MEFLIRYFIVRSKMSSKSKEKVAAVIRKIFKGSSDKTERGEAAGGSGNASNSPARRLRR